MLSIKNRKIDLKKSAWILLTNHKKYWTRFKRNDFMLEDLTKFHLDIYSQKIYNFTTDYLDKEYIVNNVPSICCLAPKLVLETVESLYNLLQCISKKLYILYSRYNIVVKEENYAQRIRYTRIIKDNLFAIERMCEKQREKNWDNWIEKVSGKNRVKTLELLIKFILKHINFWRGQQETYRIYHTLIIMMTFYLSYIYLDQPKAHIKQSINIYKIICINYINRFFIIQRLHHLRLSFSAEDISA